MILAGLNSQLGAGGVVLGLSASLVGAATAVVSVVQRKPHLMRAVRSHAVVALVGAFIAAVAMERALITRDFTVDFVADHGSSRTPALYNFATLWGALEGSIILWSLILVAYLVAVIFRFRDRLTDPLMAWALVTMFLVAAFFFALMIGPANPFGVVSPPPGYDGPGPHPLLQNHPLMAFHPPMLYLGYVGFTVPFAFAIGALVTGRLGEGWLVATRRWTLIAWGFLTVGIVLGAWWSYEVLGWGGYWAWDPVENASFLPWLTGTAYIHSVMVQERRGMLRVWNLSLLCATFSLTILGTFLTRSGVIASVHAFSESGIGPALLGLFAATIAVPVGLIAWRGDRLRAPGRIDSPISREGAFLANNVLFAAFAFVVLLGTVFPLLVEAVKGDEVSVGTPYFDRMTMPIGMSLLFLMAVAPMLPWRKASGEILADRLRWPAWIGVAAVVLSVVIGARGVAPLIAFGLGGFAAGAALRRPVLAGGRPGRRGFVGRADGGMVVRLGVVLVAVGLAASSSFLTDRVVRLEPGESTEVAGHTLTAIGSTETQHEEKVEVAAQIQVGSSGVYEPTLSRFIVSGQIIGTPSVRPGFREDIYLSLIEEPSGPQGSVLVRVIVQPLVTWIWTGGLIMGLGTVLSAFPGRRRLGTDPVSAPVPDAEPLIPQS